MRHFSAWFCMPPWLLICVEVCNEVISLDFMSGSWRATYLYLSEGGFLCFEMLLCTWANVLLNVDVESSSSNLSCFPLHFLNTSIISTSLSYSKLFFLHLCLRVTVPFSLCCSSTVPDGVSLCSCDSQENSSWFAKGRPASLKSKRRNLWGLRGLMNTEHCIRRRWLYVFVSKSCNTLSSER